MVAAVDRPSTSEKIFFEITSALEYLVIAGEEKMAKYEIEKFGGNNNFTLW